LKHTFARHHLWRLWLIHYTWDGARPYCHCWSSKEICTCSQVERQCCRSWLLLYIPGQVGASSHPT
jgi:hypothetical protein